MFCILTGSMMYMTAFDWLLMCYVVMVTDSDESGGGEQSFGGPKPMLPYSSMFIFGPTNP